MPLMDILVKTNLISEKYAALIEQKYNHVSAPTSGEENSSRKQSTKPDQEPAARDQRQMKQTSQNGEAGQGKNQLVKRDW